MAKKAKKSRAKTGPRLYHFQICRWDGSIQIVVEARSVEAAHRKVQKLIGALVTEHLRFEFSMEGV